MDYKGILETLGLSACIISMEKKADRKKSEIRIVEGNREYYDSMPGFVPGSKKVISLSCSR